MIQKIDTASGPIFVEMDNVSAITPSDQPGVSMLVVGGVAIAVPGLPTALATKLGWHTVTAKINPTQNGKPAA